MSLDSPASRAVLDGKTGQLYVANVDQEGRPKGVEALSIYDVKSLLQGKGTPGTQLRPVGHIPIDGVVARLFLSPDSQWIYYLDVNDPKKGKVGRVDTSLRKRDREVPLEEGTSAMCLSRDGKKLYATGWVKRNVPGSPGQEKLEGRIQVIDASTMQVEKVVSIDGDPCEVDATDGGLVIFSRAGNHQKVISAVDINGMVVVDEFIGGSRGFFIRLSNNQKQLYVGSQGRSPASLFAYLLPERLVSTPKVVGYVVGHPLNQPIGGEFYIMPDGKHLLSKEGGVFRLACVE